MDGLTSTLIADTGVSYSRHPPNPRSSTAMQAHAASRRTCAGFGRMRCIRFSRYAFVRCLSVSCARTSAKACLILLFKAHPPPIPDAKESSPAKEAYTPCLRFCRAAFRFPPQNSLRNSADIPYPYIWAAGKAPRTGPRGARPCQRPPVPARHRCSLYGCEKRSSKGLCMR